MSTLVSSIAVASEAVARDPRSPSAAESIAWTVRAIDEFLAGPRMTALGRLDPETKAAILPGIAGEVGVLIEGLRHMLRDAAKAERSGGPLSWTARLAEAIGRLEAEFRDIPNHPLVGEPTALYQAAASTPEPLSDESLDEILEDTMDLIRAQHTEAMSILRGEQPLEWEVVRRRLDELDKLDD